MCRPQVHSRTQLLVSRIGGGAEPGPERLVILDGRLARDHGIELQYKCQLVFDCSTENAEIMENFP